MSTAKSTGLMRSTKPVEIEEVVWNVENHGVRQPEDVGKQVATLVRKISYASTSEIDRLTNDLTDLRKKIRKPESSHTERYRRIRRVKSVGCSTDKDSFRQRGSCEKDIGRSERQY